MESQAVEEVEYQPQTTVAVLVLSLLEVNIFLTATKSESLTYCCKN